MRSPRYPKKKNKNTLFYLVDYGYNYRTKGFFRVDTFFRLLVPVWLKWNFIHQL